MSAREVEELLESLGHSDVLEARQTHSRASGREDQSYDWYSGHGLGLKRLFNFQAVHRLELARALDHLAGERETPEVLALKGRVFRLMGRRGDAEVFLERSLKARETAAAAAWLGELLLAAEPGRARVLLDRALVLDPQSAWPRLWKGLLHLNALSWDKALDELLRFLEARPGRSYLAHFLRYHAFLKKNDHALAFQEAEAAIAADPGVPAGYDMAGRARYYLGDKAGAVEFFHRARNCDLEGEGSYLFCELNGRKDWGDPQAYLEALDQVIEKSPDSAIYHAERAELKRDPKFCMYEEALADYEKAAVLAPDCAWILAVLARAKNNLMGGRSGLEEFDRAIALCAGSGGWIYSWRGAVYARLGLASQALADFERCVELMPWYSFAYAWRGGVLNKAARFEEARRDLDTAVALDPHYLFSFYERFRARAGLDDRAGAVEDLNHAFRADPKYVWHGPDLDRALAREPENPWLRAWKGHSLLQDGEAAAAVPELDRALSLDPGNALALSWRGWAKRELGLAAEARADLERAAVLEPGLWAPHKILSEIYAASGELEKALGAIAKVVELAPTTVSHLVQKARIERDLGLPREALQDLRKAVQLDRGFSEAFLLMAEISLSLGDAPGAARDIARVMELPDPPGRAYLVRGLLREAAGDWEGQIEDFKKALDMDPGLFPEEERMKVAKLLEETR
ncbi:MAG: tetratricopeptide repeat protein [Elusimicrobia bacterium]|nr:tetratricopeptide repeat protein [Elusimicrobiota bacterium]